MAYEISKADWKLFRDKLPDWQEAYMGKLNREYMEILRSDREEADKFWALEERIRKDKKHPGVQLDMRRSRALFNLLILVSEGVISREDLADFSGDLQETVDYLLGRTDQNEDSAADS